MSCLLLKANSYMAKLKFSVIKTAISNFWKKWSYHIVKHSNFWCTILPTVFLANARWSIISLTISTKPKRQDTKFPCWLRASPGSQWGLVKQMLNFLFFCYITFGRFENQLFKFCFCWTWWDCFQILLAKIPFKVNLKKYFLSVRRFWI